MDVDALEDEVGTVETGRTNVLVSSSVCVWLVLSPTLPSTTTVEVSNTVSVSISTAGAVSTCVVLAATCAWELLSDEVVGRMDILVAAPLAGRCAAVKTRKGVVRM